MFWVDTVREEIKAQLEPRIKRGDLLVVRDEKTASGRVHIGSMRGVAVHGLVADVLEEENIPVKFLYEINDFDVMDGLPAYLDEETFKPHMGKLLYTVPSPDGVAKNFAEYYGSEFKKIILDAGFTPEFYLSSELYLSGRMNSVIQTALENASEIRAIYKEISGSEKSEDWYPLHVVCEQCGKVGTTIVRDFDGKHVSYECVEGLVTWAQGCGHNGRVSPFDGNAKLPWKVEWAAKFVVLGVAVEGAGKDHSTRGGARDVANAIARRVFEYEPPFDIPYEFFLVDGKKMSSSKGAGSSARAIADLLPKHIFRLALIGTRPTRAINFEPDGNTIPTLFDRYDEIAEKYWMGEEDDDARLFQLVHEGHTPAQHYRMRFSEVAFLIQMPHIDIINEAHTQKGSELTDEENLVLQERMHYASVWLQDHAPERYVFELQKDVPLVTFSNIQKKAFAEILAYVEAHKDLTGKGFHEQLHAIKSEIAIAPKDLFSGIYQAFLGRDSGPQAGWFLSVLPRDFLIARLREVA